MRRPQLILGGCLAVLLLIIGFGAYSGFPVMDDGEIFSTLREAGLGAMASSYRDRPVNGWLLETFIGAFGERLALWVALAIAFWALLAWQTARLTRRLFPESAAALPPLAALLVISPIVVQMQYTTLCCTFPGVLPVSLALEGILLALGPQDPSTKRSWAPILSAGLVAAGALVSEYAIATLLAGVALFVVLGRPRAAIAPILGGVLGHVLFRWTSDATARPETMPSVQFASALERWPRMPLRWLNGLWHSVIGAYGPPTGAAKLDVTSGSTLLAVAAGVACAAIFARALRGDPSESVGRRRELLGLLAAVLAGLVPVIVANREPTLSDFDSRFRLPILPFCVAATVFLVERLSAVRWRFLSFGLLAYVAGYAIVAGSFRVRREQQFYDEVGRKLVAQVRESAGLTVVVVPQGNYAVPWAKLGRRWPVEDERRMWAFQEAGAIRRFGTRGACRNTDYLHELPALRIVGREGKIAQILWARLREAQIEIEPYCATPR